jgi:hypothetical protein
MFCVALALVVAGLAASLVPAAEPPPAGPPGAKPDGGLRRYIYSLHPDGSQDDGGAKGTPKKDGIIVLDIDNGCSYVRRIALPCLAEKHGGHGGRGIVGHTRTKRLYYTFMLYKSKTDAADNGPGGVRWQDGSNVPVVGCLDVENDKVLWEVYLRDLPETKGHDVGAGQAAITPDGKKLYVPPEWTGGTETTVLDAASGRVLAIIPTGKTGCGNAVMSPDGKHVYVSGGTVKTDTATDQIVRLPSGAKGLCKSDHFMIDATGKRLFQTYNVPELDAEAIVYCTATGEILERIVCPKTGPLAALREAKSLRHKGHEGSFAPGGKRFWLQTMDSKAPPADLLSQFPLVDSAGRGSIKWVTEWDVSQTPALLVKAIATFSPGHSHAHALITREGDLLLTGNGYALDTKTGKVNHAWKDKDGKWFQGTKFMQVNFRDGQVDWVGQRHGAGWLYHVPALSERGAGAAPVAGTAAGE